MIPGVQPQKLGFREPSHQEKDPDEIDPDEMDAFCDTGKAAHDGIEGRSCRCCRRRSAAVMYACCMISVSLLLGLSYTTQSERCSMFRQSWGCAGFGDTWPLKQCEFLARTTTSPQFYICTDDPLIGKGISNRLHSVGNWEANVFSAIGRGLDSGKKCKSTPGPHLVDLGSNLGFFSLYAATKGCQVLAIDGSDVFLAKFQTSIAINADPSKPGPKLDASKLTLKRHFLGDSDVGVVDYTYSKKSYASVSVRRVDTLLMEAMTNFDQQVPVAKIDIEGSIGVALKGATETFRRHLVKTWIVELWVATVNPEWVAENVVVQGYSGRVMSSKCPASKCSWRARDTAQFRAAWDFYWKAGAKHADFLWVSERSSPLL